MESVPARISSFLPSIKCSNCNADIPISQMGDHICSSAPPIPTARLNVLDGPFAPDKKPAMAAKADQPPRPRLEATDSAPSVSSVRLPFTSNGGSATSSRSVSPVLPLAERRSPYQLPPRSLTTPIHSRPPSDHFTLPQDNAFPGFPSSWSRPATPVSPMDPRPPLARTQTEPFPKAPAVHEGPALETTKGMQAPSLPPMMDPGTQNPLREQPDVPLSTVDHRRSASTSTTKEFHRPTSTGAAKFHMPRPSASSSVYTRNRSTSTVSGTSRFEFDSTDVPSVPSISEKPAASPDLSVESPILGSGTFDFGLVPPAEHPAPPKSVPASANGKSPSPYVHKPRPSVTAAMAPLDSIGSSSSFKPSRSIRGRKASIAATTGTTTSKNTEVGSSRDDSRLQNAPPVPNTLNVQQNESQSSMHTPNESTSSNGSWGSGVRSGSSRSSPPLQESPQRRKEGRAADHSFEGFQFGVENAPSAQSASPAPADHRQVNDFSRPGHPSRPPSLSTQPTLPNILPPEPLEEIPEDPPSNSPDDYMISSNSTSDPNSNQFHLSPDGAVPPVSPLYPPSNRSYSPSQPQRPPKSRSLDKGPCRGCGEPIKGKSVSSADGRLTGRYHKGCFVCTTCGNPFQTADFYVLRNLPYCSRHYHELNNSLCQGCNRGIEGQYLETETYRKFHPYCFTCQECHRILRDDYFEWRGRTLCEQHAFKAANQPSSSLAIGGGGRRYPEKRTTRLMMMM